MVKNDYMTKPTFQFTRPRGARQLFLRCLPFCFAFQFTRPRGARRCPHFLPFVSIGFNSRAREGRDSMGFYLPIFICLQRFFCETFLFFYFYIHFRIVILRNLLNINMCENSGFFCALRVRLCKIALILYHFICRLNKIYLFYGRSRVAM